MNKRTKLLPIFHVAESYAKAMYQQGYSYTDTNLITVIIALALADSNDVTDKSNKSIETASNVINLIIKYLDKNQKLYELSSFVHPMLGVQHHSIERVAFVINQINLDEREISHILDYFLESSETALIASITPACIADLMVELLDVDGGVVSDPAAGSGGLLRAALTFSKEKSPRYVSGMGVELNQKTAFIGELYNLLNSENLLELQCGNGFHYFPEYAQSDYVVSNPPINRINRMEAFHRYGDVLSNEGRSVSGDMSLNFIQLGQSRLKESGKAAYLVNMGVLYNQGDAKYVRQEWIDRSELSAVISLPGGLLPHTTNKCAILLFDKSRDKKKVVHFVKADDLYEDDNYGGSQLSSNIFETINERLKTEFHGPLTATISEENIRLKGFSLHPDSYVKKEITPFANQISEQWETLDDLAFIQQGTRGLSKCSDGSTVCIVGSDVKNIYLDKFVPTFKDISTLKGNIVSAKAGGILIKRLGDKPSAAVVPDDLDNAIIDQTVFLLSFKELELDQLHFICEFINSDRGARHISSFCRSTTVQTLTKEVLKAIDVPIADAEFQRLIVEASNAERVLNKELEKAKALKSKVFDGIGLDGVKESQIDLKFSIRTLETALENKDKTSYKIAEQYPYLLAFPYRNMYVDREWTAIYERQMKFGEQFLTFLSSIGLAILFERLESDSDVLIEIKNKFSDALKGGVSPGHWRGLFQMTAVALRGVGECLFSEVFSGLWFKGRGGKLSKLALMTEVDVVNKLNDSKHHRGPSGASACEIASVYQREVLDEMLLLVEELSHWDFFICDELNFLSSENKFKCSVRVLKGDHPCFDSKDVIFDKPIAKGDVYFSSGESVITVSPFIIESFNTSTGKNELFSLDKKTRDGRYMLKSFESGASIVAGTELEKRLSYALKVVGKDKVLA